MAMSGCASSTTSNKGETHILNAAFICGPGENIVVVEGGAVMDVLVEVTMLLCSALAVGVEPDRIPKQENKALRPLPKEMTERRHVLPDAGGKLSQLTSAFALSPQSEWNQCGRPHQRDGI